MYFRRNNKDIVIIAVYIADIGQQREGKIVPEEQAITDIQHEGSWRGEAFAWYGHYQRPEGKENLAGSKHIYLESAPKIRHG